MSTEDRPNADRIREVFGSFNNAAANPGEAANILSEAFAADAVWHHLGTDSSDSPHPGRYEGRDAIVNLMGTLFQDSGHTWHPTAVDIRAARTNS